MIFLQEETDNLDLDLVKEHLVVNHDEDDVIIMQYMTASLEVVKSYIHRNPLKTSYEAIPNELKSINGAYLLDIADRPVEMFATAKGSNQSLPVPNVYWHFNSYDKQVLFYPPNKIDFDDIVIFTGAYLEEAQITQARLLLIGTYYNYRESVADLRLTEVPNAFKLILDNISAVSL